MLSLCLSSSLTVVERDCMNISQGKDSNQRLMLTRQIPLTFTQNQAIGSKAFTAATVTEQRHLQMFLYRAHQPCECV